MKQIRPYGDWRSPITPRMLAGTLRLTDVQWNGETLVWHEGRGAVGALVAQTGTQAPRDLTTADVSVRGQVGYGGGEFTVGGGRVFFAGPGGRLYRQELASGGARPITPAFGESAAPRLSPDGRWLLYIHTYEGRDCVALVDVDGALWPRQFAAGTDFVMQPAWHPDGTYAAYIAWNHPQMPWDGTELRLARVGYDSAGVPFAAAVETLAGDTQTAIFQPEFSPDGRFLAYISDADGWNHLYVYDLEGGTHTQLTSGEADHGMPGWVQGMRTYGWSADGRMLYVLRGERGFFSLWRCDTRTGETHRVPGLEAYTDLRQIACGVDGRVALIASSSVRPAHIVSLQPQRAEAPPHLALEPGVPPSIQVIVPDGAALQIHRRAAVENTPPEQLSAAQPITWTGHDGEPVHGLYYPPVSADYSGIGAPPLIVTVHGGPTAQATAAYSGEAQFFATRGFAVLAVNYRGSTGYGKTYMNKLRQNWGIYDVEDSASGAAHLAALGLADPAKFIILGGSAGGFTVLQSLVSKPGFYAAGVCLYGVSDQFALVTDTHKFEERYSESLLGALPQAAAVYRERSPLFHAERIADPVAVFQGEDDKVVPRSQSDKIVESLRARGVPHLYHVYAGEGHGWRKPETIEHYYTAALAFLKQRVIYR